MSVPRHVAIVMDGNGRWAKKRFLPRQAGHRAGVDNVKEIVKACDEQGIEVLTLFAFSSENWNRPKDEVSYLMRLFVDALRKQIRELHERNVRIRFIGERTAFSQELQHHIEENEELTHDNTGPTLIIAANYGGQWDI
ncbi:MAG: polyprenyl diphosphate synthase, partial [Pseudomonadota bacterium]